MILCTNPNCLSKGEPQPIENFYKKANGNIDKECKKCRSKRNVENARLLREKREAENPKPKKQKNKFTEGAREALGYYQIY